MPPIDEQFEKDLIELLSTVFLLENPNLQNTLVSLVLQIPCPCCKKGTKYYIPDMDSMGGLGACDCCLGTDSKYRKLLTGFIDD